MIERIRPIDLIWLLGAIAAVLLELVLPGSATATAPAAPKPPPPISNTNCWGSLKPAGVAGEPHLLSYRFNCDTPITAYTIVVNRRPWDFGVVDDFDTSPLATLSDGTTPDPNTSWTCEGTIPTNGFNCNAGAGGSMAAWSIAHGSFDTTDPYCGNPAIDKSGSGTGTPARTKPSPPLPRAFAQLVVTDSTGAEDGPFVFYDTAGCRAKKPRKHHHHGAGGK